MNDHEDRDTFPTIPPELADRLLAGTLGREHLVQTAALARQAVPRMGPTFTELPGLLLAAALEEDSLHGPTAAALLAAATDRQAPGPRLHPDFAALLARVVRAFTIPDRVDAYRHLAAQGDRERLRAYLETECRTGRHRLFWLHVALRQAVIGRVFAWGKSLVAAALPPGLPSLAAKLTADLELLAGRPDRALDHYETAERLAPWPTGLFRLGLAAWQAGATEQAIEHLRGIVHRHPWQASATLALFDLVHGRDTARAALPGQVAICLFTYNKAQDLDRTLAGVFASDLGGATVTVLDNASRDATPAVLAGWRDRVGAQQLQVISLPINIGAPAARNWLMTAAPAVRQALFTVYLDDDVRLPTDWLSRLGAAVAAYPEAGVWGCRIADAANPAIAQGVGATLLPPAAGENLEAGPKLSGLHAETFDLGGFAHLRPCLSVMGCCHLFRTDRLLGGGFDIRFSPSQYDDLDHDLRLCLSGRPAVYQGHLAVGHARPSAILVPQRPEQIADSRANQIKLMGKHRERLRELASLSRYVLAHDLADKARVLADTSAPDAATRLWQAMTRDNETENRTQRS
jgi:GT2 family glycosyltransferase